MLQQLHDFIKENYEQGNFYSSKEHPEYYRPKTYSTDQEQRDTRSDYCLGYQQAVQDYNSNRTFRHYPAKTTALINKFSDGRISEISAYIAGYNALKKEKCNSGRRL